MHWIGHAKHVTIRHQRLILYLSISRFSESNQSAPIGRRRVLRIKRVTAREKRNMKEKKNDSKTITVLCSVWQPSRVTWALRMLIDRFPRRPFNRRLSNLYFETFPLFIKVPRYNQNANDNTCFFRMKFSFFSPIFRSSRGLGHHQPPHGKKHSGIIYHISFVAT